VDVKGNCTPRLLVIDEKGTLFAHPYLAATAWNGKEIVPAIATPSIKMPAASKLCLLPQRLAIGFDPERNTFEVVEKIKIKNSFKKCFAAALIPPPGYTRTFFPAYKELSGSKQLPLYAYTAVAAGSGNSFLTSLIRTDDRHHWEARHYNTAGLSFKIKKLLARFPENRILKQLAHCSTCYECYTAQNIFYGRWEGGIPVSNICNARCAGCLSKKYVSEPAQFRITYTPSVKEIMEVALFHLNYGESPAISFGQGCEGEPALYGELLSEAIHLTRKKTKKGLFCLNSNGSKPEAIKKMIEAGLSSTRIAINSANEKLHNAYFNPMDFSLREAEKSLKIAKKKGIFTSINLLVFPGITDLPEEINLLVDFLKKTKPDMLQLRNLGIDPHLYLKTLALSGGNMSGQSPAGIANFINKIKKCLPTIQIGNFNPIR
jgi:wyosine [tRNA(Phe)-imidazoG37] synthetase (radical SAM superfamily)